VKTGLVVARHERQRVPRTRARSPPPARVPPLPTLRVHRRHHDHPRDPRPDAPSPYPSPSPLPLLAHPRETGGSLAPRGRSPPGRSLSREPRALFLPFPTFSRRVPFAPPMHPMPLPPSRENASKYLRDGSRSAYALF